MRLRAGPRPHCVAPCSARSLGIKHDGLARGVHNLLAQERRAQVRGRNGLGDDGASLLRKGVQGLLDDLGA
jgi:hypothetical protein